MTPEVIIIEADVLAPIDKVWHVWSDAEKIIKSNNASPDWHTPRATNDLKVGGRFVYHMAARDGSDAFDFGGTYTEVQKHKLISYTMDDGRKATVTFTDNGNSVQIQTKFEAETENTVELQKNGWQAILDNFKNHVEN